MKTVSRFTRLGLAVAVLTCALDQLSKWYFIHVVNLPERAIEVLPFFKLVMVWNYGVSFGMLANDSASQRWGLIVMALMITAALAVWLFRAEARYHAVALGMVIGGAIGNVIDRLNYGAVADFFYFHYEDWYWPAFNIADSAIFIGVVILCWDSIVNLEKNPTKEE